MIVFSIFEKSECISRCVTFDFSVKQREKKMLTFSILIQLMYKYHDINLVACLVKIRLMFTCKMVNLLHLFEIVMDQRYTFHGC